MLSETIREIPRREQKLANLRAAIDCYAPSSGDLAALLVQRALSSREGNAKSCINKPGDRRNVSLVLGMGA
jgi:hypothetical protein